MSPLKGYGAICRCSQEPEIPCVTQIPLTYEDTRQPVEPEKLLLIQQAIVRQFGGFTPIVTIRGGTWVDPDTGAEVAEDQLRIEVWVPQSRIPIFEMLVRAIGVETHQKQMFMIIPQARVDRLDIQESDSGLSF